MNIGLYILIGCAVAALFGATLDIEDGDYKRAITAILACALWPFTIALGTGATLAELLRCLAAFVARRA